MSKSAIASNRFITRLESRGITANLTQLCSSMEPIVFKNYDGQEKTFTPDDGKGYFTFQYSYGFPVYNHYGSGLHPNVIAASFMSVVDQYLNYEHQMKYYDKEKDDRIIGHIVAANFPDKPTSDGWKIQADPEKVPFVSGVACFYKRSQGLNRILGEHVTGRHTWAVSMEVDWNMEECGFAVQLGIARDGKGTPMPPVMSYTPDDFLKAGWEYIPYENAPNELRATYSKKANRINAQWKGRKVVLMMGGLNIPLQYQGVALVKAGAEAPARINTLTASGERTPNLKESLNELSSIIREGMIRKIIK